MVLEYAIGIHRVLGVVPTETRVIDEHPTAAPPLFMVMVLPFRAPVELSDAPLQVMVIVPELELVIVFTYPGAGAADRMYVPVMPTVQFVIPKELMLTAVEEVNV